MKQRVFIGKEAINSWLEDVQTMRPKRCFVVRGHHSFEACGGRAIIEQLQQVTACNVTEFEDFSVNPKFEEAQVGLEKLLQSKADLIVAIGGGSVLDMAKLIRHLAAEQGHMIPLHAFPTTAGTGAEATHFAVAYIEGKKQSIAAEDVLPDVAVVYPPLTYSNNAYQTACAGFDAVAQAIESFWAKGATEESRTYSVKALELLWKQLPQLVQAPNEELRDQVAEGAYWAGRAINISTTTAPHAFSYAFTSHYNYPHGHAVALTFPFFMKLNGTRELNELLDVRADEAMQKMEEYISELGLSMQLAPEVDIKGMLQEVNIQRLSNNPIKVTPEIITELETYLKGHQKDDISRYNPEGSTLRKAQLRMLEMLIAVDTICRNHHIQYWIDFGTLLGAIRHKGFIPWDDDVDICVLEKDYEHLRDVLIQELPEQFSFQDTRTDKYAFFTYARVRDRKSYCYYPHFVKLKEQGLWVDIFRYEPIPSIRLRDAVDFLYRRVYHEIHHYGDVVYSSKVEIVTKRVIAYIGYPVVWIAKTLVGLIGKCSSESILGGWGMPPTVFQENNIFPLTEVDFEGHMFWAPGNWNKHLAEIYGDYMQVPSPEKRKQILDMKKVKIDE